MPNRQSLCDRLYVATFDENPVEVARNYDLGLEINETCVSENLDADRYPSLIAHARKDIDATGVSRSIVHGPYTELTPCSIDHLALELTRTRYEQAWQACRDLGANTLVLHAGYTPRVYFPEWFHERSVAFWKDFLKDKRGDGIRLCIENVLEDDPNMLLSIVEDVGSPLLSICLDTGHAQVAPTSGRKPSVIEWIETLGSHIGHFHLHSNRGIRDDHLPLGAGVLDMDEILQAVQHNCPSSTTFTIESRDAAASCAWLADHGWL